MKTTVVLFIIPLFAASIARADETEYARILKERDATLSKLVALEEMRAASGTMTNPADFVSARLALMTFRRDTAKTNDEKIKQQELIVALCEKQLESVKLRQKDGLVGMQEVLTATDALLQARQTLEELKQAANPPTPNPAFPKAGAAGKAQTASPSTTIAMEKDGALLFNGQKTTKDQLARLLAQARASDRDTTVHIKTDENCPLEKVRFVMDACRKEGFGKFFMETRYQQ